jgi:microcystin-dependent protein
MPPPYRIYVRTPGGWQDLAVTGAQGPAGPAGTVYDSDQIGTVKAYSGTTIPTNWMLADGRSLLRIDYPDLFTVIGTKYGSADATHFNLPDLTSKFIYGATSPAASGGTGGEATHLLTAAESGVPAHAHPMGINLPGNNAGGWSAAALQNLGSGGVRGIYGDGTDFPYNISGTQNNVAANASAPHNNMPPYVLMAQIIKVTGAQINAAGALVGPQGPPGNSVMVSLEAWQTVNATGGAAPALASGWAIYNASSVVQFRKDPLGKVQLRGAVVGTVSGVVLQLPVGYRPPAGRTLTFPVNTSGSATAPGYVQVFDTGNVTAGSSGSLNFVDLSVVEFDTDSVTQYATGPQGPAGPGVRGLVSALPGTPADGDECYYQSAAMATDGIVWHLRYRAASASPYKWEFLGGLPLESWVNSLSVAASNSNWQYPAGWPSFNVPLAGDYDFEFGAGIGVTQNGRDARVGLYIYTSASPPQAQLYNVVPTVTGYSGTTWASPAGAKRVTGLTANGQCALTQWTSDYTNTAYQMGWIRGRPVRVG